MGKFVKTLLMTVSVFALILTSVAPSAAQATVFVNGNTTFSVTWQGVKEGATLLAGATFTVSDWTGTSFKMTVTNAKNTMPVSPDINARLTAFGFGLTPEATFSNQVPGSIYQWAFTNFPAFQRVDVCLTSGGTCGGGGLAGLDQGESSPETYSLTISGAFTNGVTIIPIPAKFQTALGSLETDGVVISPPPSGASDLIISKTHNPDIAIPGGTVTYTVTVSNVGSGPSSGAVTVTETPPPGLSVNALSGTGWTCTVGTPASTCTRSDALAAGASYPPITVATNVSAGAAAGVVTNTAVVSGGGDSNSTNNTATDPILIAVPAPGMDLTITKRHSPQTVVAGQTFTYFIAVSNVGNSASSGLVTVIETPPAGLTVTELLGSGWTCVVATRTCTRSDALAPATSYPDIIVTTSVGAGVAPGTVTNTAVVSGGGDTNTGNNTATDPTVITSPVGGPDLSLLKTPGAGSASPGGTITFTIRVMNVGDAPTNGPITVTETPPPNLTVTALSGPGWTCVVATRTCLRADALPQGGSFPEITVTAVIAPDAAGTVVNGAIVTGGGDTDPGNGTGTGPIEVDPPVAGSDLTLAKARAGSGILLPGQSVTFAVRVTNVGASPTSGTVTVTETPPAGLTVTALSGSGWTCTVATRTCTRADALAPSTSYPDISVTATIAADALGTVVNGVEVSGGGDSSPGNNTGTAPIEVSPTPAAGSDLTLTKARTGTGTLLPGQSVTFAVRVTNIGASPTSGTVTVTETPPAGLTITALSGTGWACTVATRTCTRADVLAPATSFPDISVTASIAAGAVGTLVNSAAVTGGGDSSAGNNTGTSPITISPVPVPTLPVVFVIGLMGALFAIALSTLRTRRSRAR